MSKIIAFVGSPRAEGHTAQLIEEALKGAKSKGAEVKVYDLNDEGARGCQGCLYCRSHEGCATQDYLQPMYEDIKAADGVIFGSPIYFYQISGQAKQWVDRMYPMIDGAFKPRYPGKKALTVFTQATPAPDAFKAHLDSVNKFFPMFGWELVDSLVCGGTGAPDFKVSEDMLKKAFDGGAALVK